MRYRRYYSHPNPDGSRTVVSTGPVVAWYVSVGKLVLVCFTLGWPFVLGGRGLNFTPLPPWAVILSACLWYPVLAVWAVVFLSVRARPAAGRRYPNALPWNGMSAVMLVWVLAAVMNFAWLMLISLGIVWLLLVAALATKAR